MELKVQWISIIVLKQVKNKSVKVASTVAIAEATITVTAIETATTMKTTVAII